MLDGMNTDDAAIEAPQSLPALAVLRDVMHDLERAGIRYCHWKSNYHIHYAMAAIEDVDILIDSARWLDFTEILCRHGFKPAESMTSRDQPGVFHFLGMDDAGGAFINIHAYARILTGDHFLKSWALPFEKLLLEETGIEQGIRIPSASSELIIYVIRNMLKMTTLIDLFYALRAVNATIEEHDWLLQRADLEQTRVRLERYFPEISPEDFDDALKLIGMRAQLLGKIRLGFGFAWRLRKYRRYSQLRQSSASMLAAGRLVLNKFVRKQKHMQFLTGGKTIAFIGPQATGKSTLTNALAKWLGCELSVRTVHAGKPPVTALTFLPSKLIPLARRLLPNQTTIKIEKQIEETPDTRFSLVFIVRKVILAYERRQLLRGVFRTTRNGKIVISDRYPSDTIGAIDGATFQDAMIAAESSPIKKRLMRLERTLYDSICPPDLVVRLTVSVDVAVLRNKVRDKKGNQSTEYVRLRHAMMRKPEFLRCPTIDVSTDGDLAETLLAVKRAVWQHL